MQTSLYPLFSLPHQYLLFEQERPFSCASQQLGKTGLVNREGNDSLMCSFMKQDDARCFYYHFHYHLLATLQAASIIICLLQMRVKMQIFSNLPSTPAQYVRPRPSDSGVQAYSSSSQIFFSDGMPHPKILSLIQGDSITNLIFAPPHQFSFPFSIYFLICRLV